MNAKYIESHRNLVHNKQFLRVLMICSVQSHNFFCMKHDLGGRHLNITSTINTLILRSCKKSIIFDMFNVKSRLLIRVRANIFCPYLLAICNRHGSSMDHWQCCWLGYRTRSHGFQSRHKSVFLRWDLRLWLVVWGGGIKGGDMCHPNRWPQ